MIRGSKHWRPPFCMCLGSVKLVVNASSREIRSDFRSFSICTTHHQHVPQYCSTRCENPFFNACSRSACRARFYISMAVVHVHGSGFKIGLRVLWSSSNALVVQSHTDPSVSPTTLLSAGLFGNTSALLSCRAFRSWGFVRPELGGISSFQDGYGPSPATEPHFVISQRSS